MQTFIHRGQKVEEVLVSKGVEISSLEELFYLSQEHVKILLDDRFLDFHIINFIGTNVGHDFAEEFPEMKYGSNYN